MPRKTGETRPLLDSPISFSSLEDRDSFLPTDHAVRIDPAVAFAELKVLIRYGVPVMFAQLLAGSFSITTVVSVGHLGKTELSAAMLATISLNLLVLSVATGLAFSCDTLCSQAWTSSHPELTSLHAMRAMTVICCALIIPMIVIYNGESVLLILYQEPHLAHLVGQYLRIVLTGVPAYVMYEVTRKWLQNQGRVNVPTQILCVVTPLHILANYTFVWSTQFGIGYLGAAYATTLAYNLMATLTLILLYCYFFIPRTGWCGFRRSSFTGLGPAIRLGLAGLAIDSSEWIAFELNAFAASFLGPVALGAQSIMTASTTCFYRSYQAAGAGAAIRIGNQLGAGDAKRAALATRLSLYIALVLGPITALIFFSIRHPLIRLFTLDEEVIALANRVILYGCGYQIVDAFKTVSVGLLFGSGRTTMGAVYIIGSYYLVGLPIGLYLAFGSPQLKLEGLWIGSTLSLIVNSVLLTIHVLRTDFELEVVKAAERNAQANEGAKRMDEEADRLLDH